MVVKEQIVISFGFLFFSVAMCCVGCVCVEGVWIFMEGCDKLTDLLQKKQIAF